MSGPAIVVNAFDRPRSLQRLLNSLARAWLPDGVQLVISIDPGGDPAVQHIAGAFDWSAGPKEVIIHPKKLGLVAHFLFCGGLTRRYGSVVYLEDDLFVSRAFYDYAQQALAVYGRDPSIAGISLNRIHFNGYTHLPFEPIADASDTFFAQVYWYQGQVYTPGMWAAFETWWEEERSPLQPADGLHPLFLPHPRWENDFFPDAMHYLSATGRFFVFPRASHTTHFGDPGTHFKNPTPAFQVPIQNHRSTLRLGPLQHAAAVYDSYFEILPEKLGDLAPAEDLDVDLNGTKPPGALRRGRVLTTRPVRKAERTFALSLRPPELNIIEDTPGSGISLAKRGDLQISGWSERKTAARLRAYHGRGRRSVRQLLTDRIFRLIDRNG